MGIAPTPSPVEGRENTTIRMKPSVKTSAKILALCEGKSLSDLIEELLVERLTKSAA